MFADWVLVIGHKSVELEYIKNLYGFPSYASTDSRLSAFIGEFSAYTSRIGTALVAVAQSFTYRWYPSYWQYWSFIVWTICNETI